MDYKDPAYSRNVPLIRMSAMQTVKSPPLTVEHGVSSCPSFSDILQEGQTTLPAQTEKNSHFRRQKDVGVDTN